MISWLRVEKEEDAEERESPKQGMWMARERERENELFKDR
jgi:hypothetical protein